VETKSETSKDTAPPSSLIQELLELNILNASSQTCLQEYARSADACLNKLYEEVEAEQKSTQALEDRYRRQQSQDALRIWLSQDATSSAQEKIRRLAVTVQTMNDLLDPQGLATSVFQQHSQWFDSMILTLDHRANASHNPTTSPDGKMVMPLSAEWRRQASELQRRLMHQIKTLQSLPHPTQEVAIGSIIDGYKHMAKDLLQSLEVCISMQGLVVCQEQDWITTSVQQAQESYRGSAAPTTARMPLWQQAP
jgi:hypothetical protein